MKKLILKFYKRLTNIVFYALRVVGPLFILFCNFCVDLKLDGFVIQLPGEKYGKDIKVGVIIQRFPSFFHSTLNEFVLKVICKNIQSSTKIIEWYGFL